MRCELTELEQDQCAHCLNQLSPEEEEQRDMAEEIKNFLSWGKR